MKEKYSMMSDRKKRYVVVTVSPDNIIEYTKSTILQNLEEFFGARYHSNYDDWNYTDFPSICLSSNHKLTGTKKIKDFHPRYNFISYDDIFENPKNSEFLEFKEEQRLLSTSKFNQGLI